MKKILVTGGTGYIGSHTVVELLQKGFEVIIADNLSNSQSFIIDRIHQITGVTPCFYKLNLCDEQELKSLFEQEKNIDAIIHFAAFKAIGESFEKPLVYYQNNLTSIWNLIVCCETYNVNSFVFSSSASVYGLPNELPIKETTALNEPTNPYGKTKLMGEMMISDYAKTKSDFRAIFLRYFNPIGAHSSALIGEFPQGKPNNLLPYITQTVMGKREKLTVFGKDYDTPDGTCLRDYIHVVDLADAHTLALDHLNKMDKSVAVLNLGLGKAVSILEIIKAFEQVNDVKVNYDFGEKRQGDVPCLYTSIDRAKTVLGWAPKRNLSEMLQSAWAFEQNLI